MYTRKIITKLTGSEHFKNQQNNLFTVLDFWKYGFSNLNSNIIRGVLAEFIVESAPKEQSEITIRNPWEDWDVDTKIRRLK